MAIEMAGAVVKAVETGKKAVEVVKKIEKATSTIDKITSDKDEKWGADVIKQGMKTDASVTGSSLSEKLKSFFEKNDFNNDDECGNIVSDEKVEKKDIVEKLDSQNEADTIKDKLNKYLNSAENQKSSIDNTNESKVEKEMSSTETQKNISIENSTKNETESEVAPNTEYEKDGSKYKTDDLGNDYMKDGELIPNNTYKKDGHTYTTNENGEVILKDGEKVKKGGSYKDVIAPGEGSKKEVHHMPSNDSTELSLGDGPAIKMDKEDHRQTASCGRSREADEYRQKQKELIESGKFREALQMDIDDIREKFGDKYDDAIAEMLEYVDELEKEGKI